MSVRQSLLAILDQGPCYGYQLRAEFERRTGSVWPLNIGQVYTTLDRLNRDGLVTQAGTDDQGHIYWQITQHGREAAQAWWEKPVVQDQNPRDELAMKLALASTLPGVDLGAIFQAQRRASLERLRDLNRAKRTGAAGADTAEEIGWSLIVDAMIFAVEAQVRWLDHSEQRLTARPVDRLSLRTDPPGRSRTANADEPTTAPQHEARP
ncbi:PadR family transcriptional regulator [Propionicicella superfundia]|uniref:PadR family transcriptional regulator n=1 Tax=Propionicicella superfundia TaxID=348582 RepID=UPI00040D9C07|nr:PadR family transcriptional regulator [Propionicicella superfundia]